MEIGVRLLMANKLILPLFLFFCAAVLQCCTSEENKKKSAASNSEEEDQLSQEQRTPDYGITWTEIPPDQQKQTHYQEQRTPDYGITWTEIPPDQQKQTHYKSGNVIYEAIYNKDGKISSQVFPHLEDAFLHEDKFYLKVILPFNLAGEIQANTPLNNPLYFTKIDKLTYQVSLHEALDLEKFKMTLTYLPASEDSILAWEKTFEIPVIPQFY